MIIWINGEESEIIDRPLNEYFEENGYESRLFLNNIGSAIVFLLIYIVLWLIIGITKFFIQISDK